MSCVNEVGTEDVGAATGKRIVGGRNKFDCIGRLTNQANMDAFKSGTGLYCEVYCSLVESHDLVTDER